MAWWQKLLLPSNNLFAWAFFFAAVSNRIPDEKDFDRSINIPLDLRYGVAIAAAARFSLPNSFLAIFTRYHAFERASAYLAHHLRTLPTAKAPAMAWILGVMSPAAVLACLLSVEFSAVTTVLMLSVAVLQPMNRAAKAGIMKSVPYAVGEALWVCWGLVARFRVFASALRWPLRTHWAIILVPLLAYVLLPQLDPSGNNNQKKEKEKDQMKKKKNAPADSNNTATPGPFESFQGREAAVVVATATLFVALCSFDGAAFFSLPPQSGALPGGNGVGLDEPPGVGNNGAAHAWRAFLCAYDQRLVRRAAWMLRWCLATAFLQRAVQVAFLHALLPLFRQLTNREGGSNKDEEGSFAALLALGCYLPFSKQPIRSVVVFSAPFIMLYCIHVSGPVPGTPALPSEDMHDASSAWSWWSPWAALFGFLWGLLRRGLYFGGGFVVWKMCAAAALQATTGSQPDDTAVDTAALAVYLLLEGAVRALTSIVAVIASFEPLLLLVRGCGAVVGALWYAGPPLLIRRARHAVVASTAVAGGGVASPPLPFAAGRLAPLLVLGATSAVQLLFTHWWRSTTTTSSPPPSSDAVGKEGCRRRRRRRRQPWETWWGSQCAVCTLVYGILQWIRRSEAELPGAGGLRSALVVSALATAFATNLLLVLLFAPFWSSLVKLFATFAPCDVPRSTEKIQRKNNKKESKEREDAAATAAATAAAADYGSSIVAFLRRRMKDAADRLAPEGTTVATRDGDESGEAVQDTSHPGDEGVSEDHSLVEPLLVASVSLSGLACLRSLDARAFWWGVGPSLFLRIVFGSSSVKKMDSDSNDGGRSTSSSPSPSRDVREMIALSSTQDLPCRPALDELCDSLLIWGAYDVSVGFIAQGIAGVTSWLLSFWRAAFTTTTTTAAAAAAASTAAAPEGWHVAVAASPVVAGGASSLLQCFGRLCTLVLVQWTLLVRRSAVLRDAESGKYEGGRGPLVVCLFELLATSCRFVAGVAYGLYGWWHGGANGGKSADEGGGSTEAEAGSVGRDGTEAAATTTTATTATAPACASEVAKGHLNVIQRMEIVVPLILIVSFVFCCISVYARKQEAPSDGETKQKDSDSSDKTTTSSTHRTSSESSSAHDQSPSVERTFHFESDDHDHLFFSREKQNKLAEDID